jgi:hypothetical protein
MAAQYADGRARHRPVDPLISGVTIHGEETNSHTDESADPATDAPARDQTGLAARQAVDHGRPDDVSARATPPPDGARTMTCDQCGILEAIYQLDQPDQDGWMPVDFCSLECLLLWIAEDMAIQERNRAVQDRQRMTYADES